MNNIILAAFENRCPLNTFNFLVFIEMKTAMPKIDRLNMHIVYHWILQVDSISCVMETFPVWLLYLPLLFAVK